MQDHLAFVLDCICQGLDVSRIGPLAYVRRYRRAVVHCCKLALQAYLEGIGVVQAVYHIVHYRGFLIRKIDQLAQVEGVVVQAGEAVDVAVEFFDGKAGGLEGVYVAIDGAFGHLELVGKFVDAVGHVAAEQTHQPQHSFEFRLVHGVKLCKYFEIVKS